MTQVQFPYGLFKCSAHGLPYSDDILMVAIIRNQTIAIQYFKPLVRQKGIYGRLPYYLYNTESREYIRVHDIRSISTTRTFLSSPPE